jgi:hypothetical protein
MNMMYKKLEALIGISMVLMIGVMAYTVFGEGREVEGMSLSLRLHADAILPNEPVGVTLSLRNNSDQVCKLWAGYASTLRFSRISVGKKPAAVMTFGGARAGKDIGGTIEIPARESIQLTQQLLVTRKDGRDVFVFDQPGRYRLQASVSLSTNGTLESKAVDLEVGAYPSGYSSSLRFITNSIVARFVQGWEQNDKTVAMIEEMISKNQQSAYSDHVRYALGEYFVASHASTTEGSGAFIEKAYNYFSAITSRNRLLKGRAALRMAEIVVKRPECRSNVRVQQLLSYLEESRLALEEVGQAETLGKLKRELESCVRSKDEKAITPMPDHKKVQ